jgi:electron transport complex protein RnfC
MVRVGQLIADSDAFVSVPIHSSVSGTVEKIDGIRSATGGEDKVMVIKTDRKQDLVEGITPPRIRSREGFVREVRASGLVGLGRCGFSTHIKFAQNNPDEVKL